jgi:anti-sigma-K factor RskA
MNCPVSNGNPEMLLEYSAKALAPESASRLERHLAVCASCTRIVVEQSKVWQALDVWEAVPVSPTFDQKLYARIEATEARRGWLSRLVGDRFTWNTGYSFAGAAAVVALAIVLISPELRRVETPAVQPLDTSRVELDAEQVERTLEDLNMLQQLTSGSQAGGSSQAL